MPHRTPKEKRMNIDEIAVLNYCNHPNVVQYYKSYIFEDEASVIMEYMEGGSLSEAVKKFAFSEAHIAYIAREVQIIHRAAFLNILRC
jgi:serine/threonine protein kinase